MLKKNAPEWLIRLLALRADYYTRTFPNAVKDHGIPAPKPFKDDTANGLTNCIKCWINWSGGDAARQNTTGIMRKVKGEMKYTRSGGRKGSGDIRAILPGGKAASIEVKIGKDSLSDHQLKEQKRITDAGGLYFVAKDMESFCEWWTALQIQHP